MVKLSHSQQPTAVIRALNASISAGVRGLKIVAAGFLAGGVLTSCSDAGNAVRRFKQHCDKVASIKILSTTDWTMYKSALAGEYAKSGLPLRNVRLEPVTGFDIKRIVKPTQGAIANDGYQGTIIQIWHEGRLAAEARSAYLSIKGFDGSSSYECARDFPHAYRW